MDHPTRADVAAFLAQHVGGTPEDLEPLAGGAWSSAWAFRRGAEELVIRFGPDRSWYEADRMAVDFAGPGLPVPPVTEVGTAPSGLAYAISERRHGPFLETAPVERAPVVGFALTRLLVALSRAPAASRAEVAWHPAALPASSWRDLVLSRLLDHPADRVPGWRAALDDDPKLSGLSGAVSDRVRALIDACPERRDLVHGDLLHGNVLMSSDFAHVQAVISWKCSVRGDFLYDAAWCSVWGPVFYPGIAAVDPLAGLLADSDLRGDPTALTDAAVRHHCYELQIALAHLGWNLRTWDQRHVGATAALLAEIFERGPAPAG